MTEPFLIRLLPQPVGDAQGSGAADRIARALSADPALSGRYQYDGARTVTLTGPRGAPPPPSFKERRRWELHVRLRLRAELGDLGAARVVTRWTLEERI